MSLLSNKVNSIASITASLCLAVLSISSVSAKDFTSLKVIQSAHSYQCLDYKILPNPCIYMYLSCSLFGGCGIKFTARDRIRHKLPDLVVSAFRKPGNTPWKEIRATESVVAMQIFRSDPIRMAFGGKPMDGAEHENTLVSLGLHQTKNNQRFNETNVIGSPAAAVIRNTLKYTVPSIMGGPFLCKSTVKPLFPYLMSEIDAIAWRKAELNSHPDAYIPGKREIGSLSMSNLLGNTWGKVYPRIGFVIQTEPAKAAAVAAQRAIDITLQPYQIPHVYTPYGYQGSRTVPADSYNCEEGFGVWQRDPYCLQSLPSHPDFEEMTDEEKQLLESEQCPIQCTAASSFVQKMGAANEKTPAWQMIVPKESSSCEAFGSSNINWAKDKNTEDGDYAWNYWREYECCKPGPGLLIN